MDIFWGHAFSELFFLRSSIILCNFLGFAHFLGNLFISTSLIMMLFGLQTKWNQNHHKTYTLSMNKIFNFYPTWHLLPSSYIY